MLTLNTPKEYSLDACEKFPVHLSSKLAFDGYQVFRNDSLIINENLAIEVLELQLLLDNFQKNSVATNNYEIKVFFKRIFNNSIKFKTITHERDDFLMNEMSIYLPANKSTSTFVNLEKGTSSNTASGNGINYQMFIFLSNNELHFASPELLNENITNDSSRTQFRSIFQNLQTDEINILEDLMCNISRHNQVKNSNHLLIPIDKSTSINNCSFQSNGNYKGIIFIDKIEEDLIKIVIKYANKSL
ncbi:hypothetical protein AUTU_44650 (plasmid) [Aureibacter tunicatorum]|nr:hypothetical protein AUTU_44650 [Aureibacter tunicatorum]